VTGAGRLLDEPRIPRVGPGRPRTTPTALRADKAYAGPKNRALLQARGITVVIPEKSDAIARRKAKGSVGGRPLDFDAEDYKNRNVVERFFNRIKHWRAIASRYDKYATVYRGGIILAAIVDWLKHL
jgi:transposase